MHDPPEPMKSRYLGERAGNLDVSKPCKPLTTDSVPDFPLVAAGPGLVKWNWKQSILTWGAAGRIN